jgi:hypothetical protein
MAQDDMTAASPHDLEAGALQGAHDLGAGDRRQSTHTATR